MSITSFLPGRLLVRSDAGSCGGCEVIVNLTYATFGQTVTLTSPPAAFTANPNGVLSRSPSLVSPTSYVVFYAYTVESTIANPASSGCAVVTGSPTPVNPPYSVIIPESTDLNFISSAEQDFVAYMGGITCAPTQTADIVLSGIATIATSTPTSNNATEILPIQTSSIALQLPSQNSQSGDLTSSAKVGIAAGVPLGVFLISVLAGWFGLRARKRAKESGTLASELKGQQVIQAGEVDGKARAEEIDGQARHELVAKSPQELEGHLGEELDSKRV